MTTVERYDLGKTYTLSTGVQVFVPRDKEVRCWMVIPKEDVPVKSIARSTARLLLKHFRNFKLYPK